MAVKTDNLNPNGSLRESMTAKSVEKMTNYDKK